MNAKVEVHEITTLQLIIIIIERKKNNLYITY